MHQHKCRYPGGSKFCVVCRKPRPAAPDIMIECDKCGDTWMIYRPDDGHPWHQMGEVLCPDCYKRKVGGEHE